MPTPRSRRALLRGVGVTALAGSAGCIVSTESDRTTTIGGPPRTYSFDVQNRIEKSTLRRVEGMDEDAPATIAIEVANPVQFEEDVTLFERTLELAPESSTTVEDAFTTEPDKTYTIDGSLEGIGERSFGRGRRFRAGERFTAGGFGAPQKLTFTVRVVNSPPPSEPNRFFPSISVF